MALVRLAVASALGLALASCGRASGDTGSIAPPAGWRAIPELANAIGTTAQLDGVQAWGDPARGCYAASIVAAGGGDLAGELLAALAAEKVIATDIVKPTGDTGLLAFTLARGPYRGAVRAQIDEGRVSALACYHNQREPLGCETACAAWLGAK